MTLKEAKDQIARKHGYKNFQVMEENGFGIGTGELLAYADEAAELYAQIKWDEACEAQKLATEIKETLKQRIAEKFNEEFIHVSDVSYLIQSAPKPEFKP